MTDLIEAMKGMGNFGIAGLICLLIYKLVDKWAPQFLAASQATSKALTEQSVALTGQSKAMTDLATVVNEGHGQQREMLTAIRVLATEVGDLKGLVKELKESA